MGIYPDSSALIEIFDSNRSIEEYFLWLDQHPDGFVINTDGEGYQMLHKASCGYIRKRCGEKTPKGATQGKYYKIASLNVVALQQSSHVRGNLQVCRSCKPYGTHLNERNT